MKPFLASNLNPLSLCVLDFCHRPANFLHGRFSIPLVVVKVVDVIAIIQFVSPDFRAGAAGLADDLLKRLAGVETDQGMNPQTMLKPASALRRMVGKKRRLIGLPIVENVPVRHAAIVTQQNSTVYIQTRAVEISAFAGLD